MALRIERLSGTDEFNILVNGGLVGQELPSGGRVPGLVGLAITFTTPAGSHTFVAGTQVGHLSLQEIKTQLEAAVTNLQVRILGKKIAFMHATAGQAVVLAATSQDAKVILGFAKAQATTGRVLNPPGGSAPRIISSHPQPDGHIDIFIEV